MSFFDYYVDSINESVDEFGFDLTDEDRTMMESIDAIECTGDPEDAFMEAAVSANDNFHSLMEALMVDEFTTYVATNEEVIYEEGRVSKIFNTIKGFIKKAWAKIKGIFIKFKNTIMAKVGNDQEFVKKYGPKISRMKNIKFKAPKGLTFNDFKKSPMDDLTVGFGKVTHDYIVNFDRDTNSKLNGKDAVVYSDAINPTKKINADALFKKILGGKDVDDWYKSNVEDKYNPEVTDRTASGKEIIDEIKQAKLAKAAVDFIYSDTQDYYNSMLKTADRTEKVALAAAKTEAQSSKATAACSNFSSLCNKMIALSNRINRAELSAINKLRSAYRSAATKAASEGGSAKNEGTDMLSALEASLEF